MSNEKRLFKEILKSKIMVYSLYFSPDDKSVFNSSEELMNYLETEIFNFSEAFFSCQKNRIFFNLDPTDDLFIEFENMKELTDFCDKFCRRELTNLFTTSSEVFVNPSILDIANFINRWIRLIEYKENTIKSYEDIFNYITQYITIKESTLYIFTYKLDLEIPVRFQNSTEIRRNIRYLILLKNKLSRENYSLAIEEINTWDITKYFDGVLSLSSKYPFIRNMKF